MRRLVVIAVLAGLVAGALVAAPAEAKKKKKVTRDAQGTYSAPATVVGNCTQTDGIGCMTIQSGSNENYITAAKITDAHGLPVVVDISADTDGDMFTDTTYGTFCGELEEPIQIDAGAALIFWVGRIDSAAAAACAPGIGTQGTLDVTFSNVP